jgi:predicted dehydrogenase/putative sterol carrier protein
MKKINVGIIGLGRIADVHAPGYENNKEAQIYAVCDIQEEAALKRKKEWNAVKHYTDYKELLNDPEIDAVEILTPHDLHESMVIDAALAGKHIAIQKPMSVSLESADRMIDAVKDAGVIYRVTDNYAFYPPIVFAKKIIDEGKIGNPLNIRIKFIGGGSGGWKIPSAAWEWRLKESNAHNGMRGLDTFDHGHHLWTTVWFLMGEVESVFSLIDFYDGIIDSPSLVMWKHKDDFKYGSCEFTHAPDLTIPSDYYANDEWMEITGTKGIIFINRCTGRIHEGPAVSLFTSSGWEYFNDIKSDWGEGFVRATSNFIASIQGNEAPMLTGENAREILKFSLAIQKSAKERREVYLDELDSSFPYLLYKTRIRKEKKEKSGKKGFLERIGFGNNSAKYASQAKELTEEFIKKFNPNAVEDWSSTIGIYIKEEAGTAEIKYTLTIHDGKLKVESDILPDNPVLQIEMSAGMWAAILLGKKKIEIAFLQGKVKLIGKAEEALKLRSAFDL